MIISKMEENQTLNIKIHGNIFQQDNSYLYLGHTITNDGRCETKIKKRIGMAKSNFNDTKKSVDIKTNHNKIKNENCEMLHILHTNVWFRNVDIEQTNGR